MLRKLNSFWSNGRERAVGVVAACVVLLACLTLSSRLTRWTQKAVEPSWKLRRAGLHINPFRTRHALLDSGLPIFDLRIKSDQYRIVEEVVAAARLRGTLDDDLKRWAKATFVHGDFKTKVKIRVRGDLPNHWRGSRKSWRVRFPDEAPFRSMRELNLIIASDTKSLSEAFTNSVFRRLGGLTLRDGYGIVRVNGALQGVYYLVEHPTASMLASRRRAESSVFVQPVGMYKEQVTNGDTSALPPLQALYDHENDPNAETFARAVGVTDMADYARFVSLTTLFYSDHTFLSGDNHKIYYDASRGLFERIPWDILPRKMRVFVDRSAPISELTLDSFEYYPMSYFRESALRDDAFRLTRNRMLWELVRDDSLLDALDELFDPLMVPLWADVRGTGDETETLRELREAIAHNVGFVRRCLANNKGAMRLRNVSKSVVNLRFSVENLSGLTLDSVRLDQSISSAGHYVLWRDADGDGLLSAHDHNMGDLHIDAGQFDLFDNLHTDMPVGVEMHRNIDRPFARRIDGGGTWGKTVFTSVLSPVTRVHDFFLARSTDETGDWPVVSVGVRNTVTEQGIVDFPTRSYLSPKPFDASLRVCSIERFLSENPAFSKRTGEVNVVTFRDANVRLTGTVVVPKGVTLYINPGTTISMGADASLISFGPIHAVGTADAPIVIRQADTSAWGTFASVNGGAETQHIHVHVSGGRGGHVQGILFTGAVAVHNADAEVVSCVFEDNPSEDALNLKDGEIELTDTVFLRNASDGVDLDFVRGTVARCRFDDHGGDALDMSGSDVSIESCRIASAGDKGISVGERTKCTVADSVIEHCAIGIAVKDLSNARVERCALLENETAIAAYQKKPIFGGGRADIVDCDLIANAQHASIDARSVVSWTRCRSDQPLGGVGNAIASKEQVAAIRRRIHVDVDPLTIGSFAGTDSSP